MSETKRTLKIEGMHCAACVANITDALEEVPGVTGAKVDLEGGSAEVTAEESVTAERLCAAVASAGEFRARPA